MFTADSRARLRASLLERAAADPRITGAAITGSGAAGGEDRWSDIDLAFGVSAPVADVLADWTAHMYGAHHAVHDVDVAAGAWIYRVFLLPDTLQVDLAFAPEADFRPLAATFRLVSGHAGEPANPPAPSAPTLIGMAWLYALHARSAMARGKRWQAVYMIAGVRDHALALACLRYNLPTAHARGADRLPPAVTTPFEATLKADLSGAFHAALACLLTEIHYADPDLAARLESALLRLTATP